MGRHKKQKSSNLIWFIVFVIICVLLFIFLQNQSNLFKKETTTTSSKELDLPKTITFETKNIKDGQEKYVINITYPNFNISFVDQNIQKFIDKSINDFKNEFAEYEIFSDNKNSLDIYFDAYLISDKFISIRFISSIYTGGAHGNQQISTKNFDLITKREVILKDLFKNDEYLAYLSKKAIDKFISKNISNKYWIEEGVSSKYINFENFTFSIDAKNFIFHFNPYQIAPYSEGILTLEASILELQNFLKSNILSF